jgi:hypothetical protein
MAFLKFLLINLNVFYKYWVKNNKFYRIYNYKSSFSDTVLILNRKLSTLMSLMENVYILYTVHFFLFFNVGDLQKTDWVKNEGKTHSTL